MPTLLDDATTNGQFLLTYWGNDLALGFRGEPDFIRRCHNWAVNHDLAKGELHWPFDKTGRLAYVLVEGRDAIARALAAQFYGEIVTSHEVPWVNDCTWNPEDDTFTEGEVDETAVAKLAASRAEAFLSEHVKTEPFLMKLPTSMAPTYEMTSTSRESSPEE